MSSYQYGKKEIARWLKTQFPKGSTCLDVGACDGTWYELLKDHFEMDAVEIFEPYIEQHNLTEKYSHVFNCDIADFEHEGYDLIVFGDVIEHMPVKKAKKALDYARNRCKNMIILIPFKYIQGSMNGNNYEEHIQDDLTPEIFEQRYPGYQLLYKKGSIYACYAKETDGGPIIERKRLDIVISHYDEPFETVRPALEMLRFQKNADFSHFRVSLIHDGSDIFKELENLDFPFEFREIVIPKSGISAVRNYGIELADAEWITFCDCDDMYDDIYALNMLDELLDDNFDTMWNQFYITKNINGFDPPFVSKNMNWIWIHNKYFRLDFLKEKGIRFNEELVYAEDTAFNNWVRFELKDGKLGEILTPSPLYSWCRREGSATTSSDLRIRNMWHILKRNIYVSDMYKQYKRPATALMMARTVTDGYVAVMSKDLNAFPEEKKKYFKEILKFCLENWSFISTVEDKDWKYVLDASDNTRFPEKVYIPERISFKEWFEKEIRSHQEHSV